MSDAERTGPVERIALPDKLGAKVVEPGPTPRIHGYAVADDLAPNYSFAEILLLSLSGALPEANAGRAFEIALAFAAAVPPTEAPTHAAGLAKLCATAPKSVIGVAAIALAERAADKVERARALLGWLDDPSTAFPVEASAADDDQLVAELRRALPAPFADLAIFAHRPTLDGALIAVFHACGVGRAERLVAAFTVAALGTTSAEAFSVRALNLRGYPMGLPPFRYVEEP